jgi:hypothetical protein
VILPWAIGGSNGANFSPVSSIVPEVHTDLIASRPLR